MSYANVILYSSVLPSYDAGKDKKDDGEVEVMNGDNPEEVDRFIKQYNGK